MMKYWSQHSPILTIRGINLMLAEARAHNLGAVTSAYGIPEETIGRPEMRFTIETEQETDGRWIAKSVAPVPVEGVYGATRDEAVSKAREAALKAYSMTPREQTKFTEWGIVFEQGTICSAVEEPKKENEEGGVLISSRIGATRLRPFGKEGAIREGWGKPTLRHAIGYLEERYGSQEADAIAVLKDRAGLIPESPPDRPAPW